MGIRYPRLHDTWTVNIGYFMVRDVSLAIPLSDIPWYVTCHSRFRSDIPWYVKCHSRFRSDIPWYVKCYSRFRSDIPWYVKCHSRFPIGFSTVREVSFGIPLSDISRYVKCHSGFPIRYSTVREVSFGIPLSDISRYVKSHSRFPYWIFDETKVWECINVSWKGTLYMMHASPNSLQTPLITMWHKYNNQA